MTRGGVKIKTTGDTFTAIGGKPVTEGADLRPLCPSTTAAPVLPWHNPKIKQRIPTTSNVPKALIFSGFPNILLMPLVLIKGFSFLYKYHTIVYHPVFLYRNRLILFVS